MLKQIPQSPCLNCPMGKDGKSCNKQVSPTAPNRCKKWGEWFRESWQKVVGTLREF